MFVCLFVCSFGYVFVCLFCLFVYLFVSLFICLYMCVGFRDAPHDACVTVMSARGIATATSQVPRNCGCDCVMQRASNVQRSTVVNLRVPISAPQTSSACALYVRNCSTRPPPQLARPFGRRLADASALRQRAGATSHKRSVALAQITVTHMGTELCSIFVGHPVMRKVGESLSMRAPTPLWLCAAKAYVARAICFVARVLI